MTQTYCIPVKINFNWYLPLIVKYVNYVIGFDQIGYPQMLKKQIFYYLSSNFNVLSLIKWLYIDGIAIDQVEHTKFLGVVWDCKLSWKKHIVHIKLKISRVLGVMGRVCNILPLKVITMLYYTLIHLYIVYCNIVWGYAKSSILKKLQSFKEGLFAYVPEPVNCLHLIHYYLLD